MATDLYSRKPQKRTIKKIIRKLKCIDLTVTSHPYDNLRKYNGYTFRELLIDIHIRIMDIQSRIPPSKEEIDISGFKKPMHDIQKKLIIANKKGLLIGKGYRSIAKLVGISHPQQVKHHLQQLKKHHLI